MIKVSKLKEAVFEYGTPLYVYDLDIIEKQYIDDILYSPNGVGLEEIIEANNLGVKLNLDSLESIEAFTENYSGREISIRINPDIYAGGNERISVGHRDSKFGISEDKLSRLVKIEEEGKLIVSGIHVHTGSDILKNEELELTVNKIFKIARKFKNLKSINLGGGIKVPYFDGDSKTDLKEYSNVICRELDKFTLETNKDIQIMLEPGKFLTSESGFFLTKVNNIKKSYNTKFVQVNSGFNHFIRPTLYNSYHEIIKLNKDNDEKETYNVVGYICEKDTFAQQRTINKLKVGDLICFKNAGAYCFSMSSNYNSRVKPAEACIINNKIKLIRKRETVENLLKNQINIFVK